MYLENKTNSRAYWQTFKTDDLVRAWGFADGWLASGAHLSWGDSSRPTFVLSVKKEGGAPIQQEVGNGDDLIFDDRGLRKRTREYAIPVRGTGGEPYQILPPPPDPRTTKRLLVVNKSNTPVHVALSWGGVIQEIRNDLPAGDHDWFSLSAAGLHDVTIMPAFTVRGKSTAFDSTDHNAKSIGAWTTAIVGLLAAIPTGGASLALTVKAGVGLSAAVAGAGYLAADALIEPSTIGGIGAWSTDLVVTGGSEVRGEEIVKTSFETFASNSTVADYPQMTDVLDDPSVRIVALEQRSSKRMLDADGTGEGQAVTRPPDTPASRRWILTDAGDETHWVQQLSTGRYLDAHQSASHDYRVVTRPGRGRDDEGPGSGQSSRRWGLVDCGDGSFKLRQRSSGRILDAHDNPPRDHFDAVTRGDNEQASRRWIVSDEVHRATEESAGPVRTTRQVTRLSPSAAGATHVVTTEGVDGANVAEVDVTSGDARAGGFRNTTGATWVESGADGSDRFTFVERNRDDWSVYLRDDSRGIGIQLDVFRKRVRFNTSSSDWTDLYAISEARRRVPG